MAIIEGGSSGLLMGVGEQTGSPGHVGLKPTPYSTLGHYRLAATSGTLAAALAANGQVFTWRWTDATRLCVISRVKLSFQCLTVFTAGTLTDFGFDMFKVTAVSAGGGGTAITAFSKMRSNMATSLLGATDVRISTTAALTALTTLDGSAIAQSIGDPNLTNPAGGTEEARVNDPTLLFEADMARGEHPLVLSQNEGFVLRNRTVWPAAGTGIVQVEVSWCETTAF